MYYELFCLYNEKNEKLKKEQDISFEDIVFYIEKGAYIEIIEHPNQNKYKGQKMYVMNIENYIYIVPFVESEETIFLKTIINNHPKQKSNQKIFGGIMSGKLDKEEQELLESFENGEWQPIKDMEKELKN